VTGISPVEWLELTAEMKLPGNATLSFQIKEHSPVDERTELEMIARFRPRGLFGIAYWYSVLPLHGFVFRGMLQGISRAAIRKNE
tara:strand:- start:1426 stop:1680 length:255 start_codon:yes stop_codon:yes gene_type:complete